MSLNVSGISSAATTAAGLGGLVGTALSLVTPQQYQGYQPQNAPAYLIDTDNPPPPSLLFNYEGENTATLKSDITDHFIEDNSTIQDQIALKPVMITVRGFVGELNNVLPAPLKALQTVAEKLTLVPDFFPELTASALLALAQAQQAYAAAKLVGNVAVSAWSTINGDTNQTVINGTNIRSANVSSQTQQQIYFQQFFGYWSNRTLFTVQTPWAIFQDMAIETLRAVQDEETRMITDFEITFKQIRFATTVDEVSSRSSQNYQSRLSSQGASEVDLGTNNLSESSTTFSSAAGF